MNCHRISGRHALSAVVLLTSTAFAAPSDTPLLDFAASLRITDLPGERSAHERLRAAQQQLAQAAPPADACNTTLGAQRYAQLYRDLAFAHEALGESRPADNNLQRALACAPRDPAYLASRANQLLRTRHFDDARALLLRGLAIAPHDFECRAILLQLNFLEQRWNEVMDLADGLIADDLGESHWRYWQILRRIAALRSGFADEHTVVRAVGDDWPTPVWLLLNGKLTQRELVAQLAALDNPLLQRQRLCEALFYQGEVLLARGDAAAARLHFAMATRMKALYFVEHDLALDELERLRTP